MIERVGPPPVFKIVLSDKAITAMIDGVVKPLVDELVSNHAAALGEKGAVEKGGTATATAGSAATGALASAPL